MIKRMSPDDESLLGAYLDGELEPEQRRAIESSLATDSLLAEKVQGLLGVRDLVADLSRPASADFSPAVMRRIHEALLRPRPWTLGRHARRWVAGGLGVATVAAALVALLSLLPVHRVGPAQVAVSAQQQNSHSPADRTSPDGEGFADLGAEPRAAAPPSLQNTLRPETRVASSASRVEKGIETNEHQRFRTLIDDPHLRRVFLVTDQIGQPAEQQVATLVERTTHHDYFKITVAQGIVIDQRHPGKATVFAVVLDETELAPFRDRLKNAFKDRLQEEDVEPAVAMQLADIGQVVSFPAHPIGDLTIPPSNLALRAAGLGGPERGEPALGAAASELDEPTAEQERSSPAAGIDQSEEIKRQAAMTIARSPEPSGRPASAPAPIFAPDARGLAHAGNSRDSRHAADPTRPLAVMSRAAAASDEHHLVVLVWIADTSSG
jgi:hypothetical protein